MKKVLTILGVAFLALIIAVGAAVGYAMYMGARSDASSKAYVDQTVPAIVSTWSADRLLQESSSELRRRVSDDQMFAVFKKFSALGKLLAYHGSEGQSQISFTPRSGKVITAKYEATARCEHGDVAVNITLVQENGRWRILGFFVNSDQLLK
jgi:hypothetical protein